MRIEERLTKEARGGAGERIIYSGEMKMLGIPLKVIA